MISKTQENKNTIPEPKKTKGIKPETNQDKITYNLYNKIMSIVQELTEDPEIINDVNEELQQYIKPKTIPTEIVKLDELENKEYIDNLFDELFLNEISNGLKETAITPEAYNYKILEILKDYIKFETGTETITIKDSNTIEIKNPAHLKYEIGYFIQNQTFKNIQNAISEVLYILDENPDTARELEQFIYLNSYYKD